MIPLTHFLLIGAALFAIGLFIVLTKKNIIQVNMISFIITGSYLPYL
jgi:NADH:ubiquinone oxidoreductase subunit K